MLNVTTKEELKSAKENKVKEFVVVGALAEKIDKTKALSKLSKKKVAVLSAALIAGAVAAIPTGGTSLGLVAAATEPVIFGTGLSTGAILAISSAGGIVLIYALYKDYSIEAELEANGTKKLKFTRK